MVRDGVQAMSVRVYVRCPPLKILLVFGQGCGAEVFQQKSQSMRHLGGSGTVVPNLADGQIQKIDKVVLRDHQPNHCVRVGPPAIEELADGQGT